MGRDLCVLSTDPSSTVLGRAWSDERWGFAWMVAGLLAELAFAFPTHEDDDADGAQNRSTDEPTDPKSVPVIVERTVFIFWVVGIQDRQACQEEEQAQCCHLPHVSQLTCVAPQAAWKVPGEKGRMQLLSLSPAFIHSCHALGKPWPGQVSLWTSLRLLTWADIFEKDLSSSQLPPGKRAVSQRSHRGWKRQKQRCLGAQKSSHGRR